ncbi:hypothetical protein KY285_026060 [Solanum tuberosum]|nr:hypothetical protein KY285_026060 [Solanum tuberosum]
MSFGIDTFGSKNIGIGSSSPMITSEPLMGSSNYLAWASSVELWCKGQGVQDHLTNIACVVDEKAKASGEDAKAKAQWEKARALYTNDISRFYDVISRMTNLKKQESDMSTYLGQVQEVMEEFETLMPVTTDVQKQQEHRQTLFLVLTLAGLPTDHDSVRDQILASLTIPTVDELFSRPLRLAPPLIHKVVSSPTIDSSALASQTIEKRAYPSIGESTRRRSS